MGATPFSSADRRLGKALEPPEVDPDSVLSDKARRFKWGLTPIYHAIPSQINKGELEKNACYLEKVMLI